MLLLEPTQPGSSLLRFADFLHYPRTPFLTVSEIDIEVIGLRDSTGEDSK